MGECHICRDERGRFWFFPWCMGAVHGGADVCTCPSRQPKKLPKWQLEMQRRAAIERVAETSRTLMRMLARSEAELLKPRENKRPARYLAFEVPHGSR